MSTETHTLQAPPKRRVRGKTISIKRLSKRELERGRVENPPAKQARPQTRGECKQGANVMRPCPFVSCKYHLYLEVSPRSGGIKLNFPHLEVWELPETCALDVADRGGIAPEPVGSLLNMTRMGVRLIERAGLKKLKNLAAIAASAEEGRAVFRSTKPRARRAPAPPPLGDRKRAPVPAEIVEGILTLRETLSYAATAKALRIGKQTLWRVLTGAGASGQVVQQLRAELSTLLAPLKRAA